MSLSSLTREYQTAHVRSLTSGPVKALGAPQPPEDNSRLDALASYIPTETITLYVATLSAKDSFKALVGGFNPLVVYWIFLALNLLLAVVLALRQRVLQPPPAGTPQPSLPYWRIVASTIAFAVWALWVPGNEVLKGDPKTIGAAVALGALFVSTLLNLVAPFFEPKKP